MVVAGFAAVETAPPRARLSTISATLGGRGASVLIESSAPVAYVTARPDPLTVLVDLRNVTSAGAVNRVTSSRVGPVAAVTFEDVKATDGAAITRVRVLLATPAQHRVHSDRNVIQVDVVPDDETVPAAEKPRAAVAPLSAATATPATRLEAIRANAGARGVEVTLAGNGTLLASSPEVTRAAPYRLVLDFEGVASKVPAVTPIARSAIRRVRVATHSVTPRVTRVVFDLAREVPYTLQPAGNELKVLFVEHPDAPASMAPAAPAVAPVTVPASVPARGAGAEAAEAAKRTDPQPPPAKPAPATVAPAAAPQVAAPPQTPPPTTVVPSSPSTQPAQTAQVGSGSGARQYTGHPISLDFQGADLRSVLRTFSEISALNMVIDPQVQGTVDVALRDVPWDQALDIILRANKLGYVVDGTVVRIAPLAALSDEEGARRKLSDEQALSGELKVMTHALSYAKAEDLKTLIERSALTKRGDVQVDPRTNTLIIRDLPNGLETVSALVATLDKPQPQVEIEARIVQTTRDFARSIGVQWGIGGRMAPQLANTTSLAFPNSVSVGGRTGGVQAGVGDTTAVGTAVNLGVSAASSAIGIALGSVNGAFNLDVALSALETSGKGRILSTPRVSTQNNQEAEVMQGTQIPIQTIANNTVTVTFKDAALSLKVTPQITASNTVILKILLENATADFSRAVGPSAIPPIDTQRATSTVLVKDGETTVIGGIYVSQEQASLDKTPGASRIPLLGWLFRRDAIHDQSRELLIFITPRIAKL
jgi:type IV pilus assembly protein PilQ